MTPGTRRSPRWFGERASSWPRPLPSLWPDPVPDASHPPPARQPVRARRFPSPRSLFPRLWRILLRPLVNPQQKFLWLLAPSRAQCFRLPPYWELEQAKHPLSERAVPAVPPSELAARPGFQLFLRSQTSELPSESRALPSVVLVELPLYPWLRRLEARGVERAMAQRKPAIALRRSSPCFPVRSRRRGPILPRRTRAASLAGKARPQAARKFLVAPRLKQWRERQRILRPPESSRPRSNGHLRLQPKLRMPFASPAPRKPQRLQG